MNTGSAAALTLAALAFAGVLAAQPAPAVDGPAYTAKGELTFPANYRRWIYLSSGLDMSYRPGPPMPGLSQFDNVFVNPAA